MAQTFYEEMQELAAELMAEFGRDVDYIQTNSSLSDVSKPWKGSVDDPTITTMKSVVIPPAAVRIYGLAALGDANKFADIILKSQKIFVLAPMVVDMKLFDKVFDEHEYRITGLQVLKPGDLTLLAYVGASR